MFTPTLCLCGCGQPAPIATETRTARGHLKGQPARFRRGHNMKTPEERARISRLHSRPSARKIDREGYVLIKAPGHPQADCQRYVREHRLVMESRIDRLVCSPPAKSSTTSTKTTLITGSRTSGSSRTTGRITPGTGCCEAASYGC